MTATTGEEIFPVLWDDPEDAKTCWRHDPVHMGVALPPLEFELGLSQFLQGFGWGMVPRLFNYYVFYSVRPRPGISGFPGGAADPDAVREGGRRWRDQILPEVVAHSERYRTMDVASFSNEELAEEIERLPELRYRSGELHTLAVTPGWQGFTLLIGTFKELTGGDELGAARLLQGRVDKSFEAGERLWRVARVAKTLPAVKECLLGLERDSASETLATLRSDPVATPFIGAFDAYLEEFGWRTNAGFTSVPWIEDPTVPLMLLRSHLRTHGYDPNDEQRRLAAEAERALQDALDKLDEADRARLTDALRAARAVCNLSEDHNFYIDQRLWCLPGRLIREAGRRLVDASLLSRASDVAFLHADELLAALRKSETDLGAVASKRLEEFAHWRTQKPPPFVGTPPPGGASATTEVPLDRDGELNGTGVSAGIARGAARIVRSLAEADRLGAGDILVTSVTQPAWTPLFAIARAVVTEVGGMLTHTAIAAREFGIPAVVALPDATHRIPDGRLIEVDGAAGTVHLL